MLLDICFYQLKGVISKGQGRGIFPLLYVLWIGLALDEERYQLYPLPLFYDAASCCFKLYPLCNLR